jgi:hypothetical protein
LLRFIIIFKKLVGVVDSLCWGTKNQNLLTCLTFSLVQNFAHIHKIKINKECFVTYSQSWGKFCHTFATFRL